MLFLSRVDQSCDENVAREAKASVTLEDGLVDSIGSEETQKLIEQRKSVEDETICFVSLDNWKEAELGVSIGWLSFRVLFCFVLFFFLLLFN